MSAASDLRDVLATTVRDHRAMLGYVRSIETLVEGPCRPATGDVARRLSELAEFLEEHFEEEEGEPLYTWIPKEFPGFAAESRELQRQHGPLLVRAQRLAKAVEKAESLPLDSILSTQIRELVAELRQHEAHEAKLIQHVLVEADRIVTAV